MTSLLTGLDVRELRTLDEMRAASDLVRDVWGGGDHLPIHLQRAVAHAGSYVAGALRDGILVGATLGFLGLRDGALVLHSHVTGVLPGAQGRNVGFALKQHQRTWALKRGVRRVTWTFDPLVRRNAYFNLCKLAARGVAYEANFYGPLGDGINGDDESDRLLVEWPLDDPAVVAAAAGQPAAVDTAALRPAGAQALLEVGPDGTPLAHDTSGPVLLCQVPEDIVGLRGSPSGREASARWRDALRDTLGRALDDGYTATGMTRDGWYVLSRGAR